jgi:hypothetical protein
MLGEKRMEEPPKLSGNLDSAFLETSEPPELTEVEERNRPPEQRDEASLVPVFKNQAFDDKMTALMLFGMMLAKGIGMANLYADAARRAGATWKELYIVADLASSVTTILPAKSGTSMVNELRKRDGEAGSEDDLNA